MPTPHRSDAQTIPHPHDKRVKSDRLLELDASNWRVYTARARAYFVKGMFAQAKRDNEAAAAINPNSTHVKEVRGKLNEQLLRPEVILEDHH